MAADQGLATAQNDLGIMYLDGKGIKKDRQKARELFSSAAMQNNAEAKRNLKLLEDETKKTIMKELYGDTPQGNDTITCKTRCTNGDCYRTYSDGRTVHFQAQMKLNPFTNQMEFDSGGC
ncbi:MAG: hypothetical protein PHE17_16345 [Thiothrix sp.]|uniref:tetratricopeptide repeat protein n=1 Tax=Thiothrix sp. TaxID=1032 RepID=UPI002602AC84|nr:hypothetical protein [Thiothrix sp.]MDD5394586.1 hypothetical protein [Thiothrix sp.]